jgi:GT2 family glycosyltransferase
MKSILKKLFRSGLKKYSAEYTLIKSSDLFDNEWYLTVYSDVAELGIDPVVHYLNHGGQEGRLPGPLFDNYYYFSQVVNLPESQQIIENPLLHYLKIGKAAGLQVFNDEVAFTQTRDNNRFIQPLNFTYETWIQQFDDLTSKDRLAVNDLISKELQDTHLYLVNLSTGKHLKSIEGLDSQLYSSFSCVSLVDFKANINDFQNQWVVFFDANLELREHALFWLAYEIKNNKNALVIYSDHDQKDVQGKRSNHWFKPDWSPEYFMAISYLDGFVAFKMSPGLVNAISHQQLPLSLYELVLKTFEYAQPFDNDAFKRYVHIPAILFHYLEPVKKTLILNHKSSLITLLQEFQINADITQEEGFLKVLYELNQAPKVSIVVPTKDRLDVLKPCLQSVLHKTTYCNFEVLLVNNQSGEAETYQFFDELEAYSNVKVLDYNEPFNYSAINNFAVKNAAGDIICLLNNDTEVIDANWLDTMVAQLEQPNVGVVGAKLLFANGSVQHVGDAVGPGGCADHFLSELSGEKPGYGGVAVVAHEVSAVTAACLLTTKAIFNEVKGLDEQNLPVAFNDVDFCLRVRDAGYRIVMTPYARLYHYESISRGKDISPEKAARAEREIKYIQQRWAKVLRNDPFYNPNLNYDRPDFKLNRRPRTDFPWKKSFEK